MADPVDAPVGIPIYSINRYQKNGSTFFMTHQETMKNSRQEFIGR